MRQANPYLLLVFSIITEVLGTTMMKLSDGFSLPVFTIITIACYLLSFTSLTFTLQTLQLGFVYGVWGGAGTALTALIGIVVWNDPFGWSTCVGIALIIGGIVLLNKGTKGLSDFKEPDNT